jgi:hypothetical protein
MPIKTEWEEKATNLLKAELARQGLSYEDLSAALAKCGIEKPSANLTKTINLGKFSFAFFLQCTKALGLKELRLD